MHPTAQVCFVLGLQAVLFHAPRALWSFWERNTIYLLSRDLAGPLVPADEAWSGGNRKARLVDYFANINLRAQHHNLYALRYLLCELINLVNVVSVCKLTSRRPSCGLKLVFPLTAPHHHNAKRLFAIHCVYKLRCHVCL